MGQEPNKYHISDDGKIYRINDDGSFTEMGDVEDSFVGKNYSSAGYNPNKPIFPKEIKFSASLHTGLNTLGGKLIITPTQFIFHPHKLNFGNLSDRVYRICDIIDYKKNSIFGLSILLKDGSIINLEVYKKNKIIRELETRKINLQTQYSRPKIKGY